MAFQFFLFADMYILNFLDVKIITKEQNSLECKYLKKWILQLWYFQLLFSWFAQWGCEWNLSPFL